MESAWVEMREQRDGVESVWGRKKTRRAAWGAKGGGESQQVQGGGGRGELER